MKLIIKIMIFFCFAKISIGQNILSQDAAVQAALQNSPLLKAAVFDVKARKYAEKAALNLPNPEVNAESPTGEFYAIGVMQSFEFPTVYNRQKQVAKAETALAQVSQRMSENDLRYTVRSLYLEVQVAEYQRQQWTQRDSIYQQIKTLATRQFTAGEIDFLQKTMAENEAGKVRQERLAAERSEAISRQQLINFTGLTDLGLLLPLEADTVGVVAMFGAGRNLSVVYQQQAVLLAEQQIKLAKSKTLPNFSLGYLNQGARTTPIDYRFRASVGIPLWLGQYRAETNMAKAESQAAVARAEAQIQAITLESQRAQSEAVTALANVQYHRQEALPLSISLIAAATRMKEAGQIDYVTFLRTLDEAYLIQLEYAVQLATLYSSSLKMQYLSGN